MINRTLYESGESAILKGEILVKTLNKEITDYFTSVLRYKIKIQEFENWLYTNEDLLEGFLGNEVYFNLVNLNYKSKFIYDDLEPLIISILDYKSYEDFRIRDTLKRLVSSEEEFIGSCRQIYNDYCNGHYYLRSIALKYIVDDYDDQLFDPIKRNDFIKQHRQEFIEEILRLLNYFEEDKIEIVGENEYIDLRDEDERIEERYWK